MSTSRQADKTATDSSSIAQSLSGSADTTELVEAVTELSQRVSELESTVQEQAETIQDLRDDLRAERDERGRSVAETRQQVTELREDVEDTVSGGAECGGNTSETTTQEPSVEPQTDIEQMSRMPEPVLSEQTANVQRAVFVAKDVEAYTTSCPAGRVIKSGELRRVLEAGTDCSGHTQTVARVMDLLDRTGGEDTTVVERRGERRLVFEQDLVDRLSALTSQSRGGDSQRGQAV
jgi:uncharacterized coiled-coil protein SlyX